MVAQKTVQSHTTQTNPKILSDLLDATTKKLSLYFRLNIPDLWLFLAFTRSLFFLLIGWKSILDQRVGWEHIEAKSWFPERNKWGKLVNIVTWWSIFIHYDEASTPTVADFGEAGGFARVGFSQHACSDGETRKQRRRSADAGWDYHAL